MPHKRLALFIALIATSCSVLAVTPLFWENFTQEDLLKGTLTRVSLGADGRLSLAPDYAPRLDAQAVSRCTVATATFH